MKRRMVIIIIRKKVVRPKTAVDRRQLRKGLQANKRSEQKNMGAHKRESSNPNDNRLYSSLKKRMVTAHYLQRTWSFMQKAKSRGVIHSAMEEEEVVGA